MCMMKNELAAYLWPRMIRTQKFRENHRFTIAVLHDFFFLGGQSLRGDQDTKDELDWLKGLAATFCDEGIQKLVPRCDRCHNLHCVYLEKWCNVGTNMLQKVY
jgi:hypothetical protein